MCFLKELGEVAKPYATNRHERGSANFTITDDGELENIFWATGAQRQLSERYGGTVILDNTFNSNM